MGEYLNNTKKRFIENNNITVEKVEQGNETTYYFLVEGCYNQQKPKITENDAYLAAIDFILSKKYKTKLKKMKTLEQTNGKTRNRF